MRTKLIVGIGLLGLVGWLVSKYLHANTVVRNGKRVNLKKHKEDMLDSALIESFPASDPVSVY